MRKRIFAAFVCLCMLMALVPSMAYADGTASVGGLCEHHPQHDSACGYSEGTAEVPCNHEHTEDCYTLVTNCVHEHTAECYSDGILPAEGEEKTADNCSHQCSEESGCITKELNCNHEHDENCGYIPATAGTPCGFVCEICKAQENGNAISMFNLNAECNCTKLCTEGNISTICPFCSTPGADLSQCKGEPIQIDDEALFAGGVRLIGTDSAPAYALTQNGSVEISGASESNYNIKWDGSTLTLKNANITNGNYSSEGEISSGFFALTYIGIETSPIEIVLVGQNTITAPSNGTEEGAANSGIYSIDDITISGNGSLTATAPDWSDGDSYGIRSMGNIIIEGDVEVIAQGGNIANDHDSYGISSQKGVTIKEGANVTAISGNGGYGSYGIKASGLSVQSAQVKATSGTARVYNAGISVSNCDIFNSKVDARGNNVTESYSSYASSCGIQTFSGGTFTDSELNLTGYSYAIYGTSTISINGCTGAVGDQNGKYGIYTGGQGVISIDSSDSLKDDDILTVIGKEAAVFPEGTNGQFKVGVKLDLYGGENNSNANRISFVPGENIKELVSTCKYIRVEKAKLSVLLSASETNKVYDSEDITLTAISSIPDVTYQWYKDDTLIPNENGNTLKLKDVSQSGVYRVAVSDSSWQAKSNTLNIEITKATPVVKVFDTSVAYTGFSASVGDIKYDVELFGDDTFDPSSIRFSFYRDMYCMQHIDTPTDRGDYYVKASFLGSSNYTEAESSAAKFTITFGVQNVSASGYSGVYDGNAHSITVTADEDATVMYSTNGGQSYQYANPAYTEVGVYTVYYRVTKPNYKTVTGTETVEIKPAALSVTAEGYSGVYDGNAHSITVTADEGATVTYSEDGTSYSASKPSYTDVGTYTVYYKVTKPNYEEVVDTATVEIMPASLTVISEGYTGIYDGKAHAISVTADAGTTVMYSVNGEPYSENNPSYTDVGTYTVSYKVTKPNYQEVVGTATVEITPASLNVNAEGYSGTYDGKAHAIMVTADTGATVMYSVNGEPYSENNPSYTDVGTYTVSYKVTKPNYQEVQGVKTVEITPAVLTAAYESETIRVGKEPALKVNVTGFVNGENADTASDYVAPTVTTSETERGRYELTPSGGSARNYTFVYVSGTLTISKPSNGGSVFFWDLKFDTNGGSDINTVTEWEFSTIDLDEYVPEKEGYKFAGWYADKDFDKKIDEVYLTQDTTVYAKWEKIAEEVPEEPEEVEETEETETISFKDVKESDWFYKAVSYAVDNGLMSGMSEDAFAPNTPLTREMLAVVLYNVEGQPESTGVNPFTDVKADMWYTDAILWANENGIVAGYDNSAYGVGDLITREQFATILYRYAQFKGYDVSVGADTNILSYADAFDISEYAYPAMQWACGADIMGGMDDGTLMPQGKATRAEAATMLMNFCENIMEK